MSSREVSGVKLIALSWQLEIVDCLARANARSSRCPTNKTTKLKLLVAQPKISWRPLRKSSRHRSHRITVKKCRNDAERSGRYKSLRLCNTDIRNTEARESHGRVKFLFSLIFPSTVTWSSNSVAIFNFKTSAEKVLCEFKGRRFDAVLWWLWRGQSCKITKFYFCCVYVALVAIFIYLTGDFIFS